MYRIIDHADSDGGIREYVVDTLAELAEISCSMGSTAFCIENMSLYIKDGKGQWRKM
jgi:hypothetical protein